MNTNRNHTGTTTRTKEDGRGYLTVALAAAVIFLTMASSLVLTSRATGAAPAEPAPLEPPVEINPEILDEGIQINPGVVENGPLVEINKWLKASVLFACRDENSGFAKATVTNNSPSHDHGYSFEVNGPGVSYVTPGSVAPGSTVEEDHVAGGNGDAVQARVRDANGVTLAYESWTVDCAQAKPSASVELVCKDHGAYVVVSLVNDGTAPITMNVFFVLTELKGGDLLPASRSVSPGQTEKISYEVEEGESYSVWVTVEGHDNRPPLVEETVEVDCHRPEKPHTDPETPSYTPPPGTPKLKFTG